MPSGTGTKTQKKINTYIQQNTNFKWQIFMQGFVYVSLQHTAAFGLLCDLSSTFQLSPPGVSTRVTTREHPAAEDGTMGEKCPEILPKCRLTRYI